MIHITPAILASLSTKENPKLIGPLADAMNEFLPQYEITTEKRVEHFLAQACHESDGFKTLTEYASGDAYDTRTDLGNTAKKDGDGRKYKGRGLLQTTGKTNYEAAGKAMGLDLIKSPELLAEPRNAVWAACIYWKSRRLNALADKDDLRAITKKINGGYNGLADRQRYLDRARPLIKSADPTNDTIGPGSDRDAIVSLQKLLLEKKYQPGRADGKWGKLTRAAVLALKADNGFDTSNETITFAEAAAAPERVLEGRKDATVADLRAEGSSTVAGADKVQVASGVTLAGTGLGVLSQAEAASGIWARIRGVLEPFEGMLPWVAEHLWVLLIPAAGAGIWFAHKAKQKRLEEFKSGKMG